MSDLLTAAVWTGLALLAVLLVCTNAYVVTRLAIRRDDRRRQALAHEAALREIENTPIYRADPIIDSLPADIRKDFQ